MRSWLAAITAAASVAVAPDCKQADNSIDGTIGGRSYPVKGAVGFHLPPRLGPGEFDTVGVILVNHSIECSTTYDQIGRKDLRIGGVAVRSNAPGGVAPGTFAVHGLISGGGFSVESAAEGDFISTDSNCTPSIALARSGSVTLGNVTDPVEGSFDVVLDTGDRVTGSFSASSCSRLGLQESSLFADDGGIASCP